MKVTTIIIFYVLERWKSYRPAEGKNVTSNFVSFVGSEPIEGPKPRSRVFTG
jgi:hypothetical protein